MAHFQSIGLLKQIDKHLIPYADSVGFNEQEMATLLDLWKGKDEDIGQAHNANPTLEHLFEKLATLTNKMREKQYRATRLHFHAFGYHILCYDERYWEDGQKGVFKSNMASAKWCNEDEGMNEPDAYRINPPESFTYQKLNGQKETIKYEEGNLEYEFYLDDHM